MQTGNRVADLCQHAAQLKSIWDTRARAYPAGTLLCMWQSLAGVLLGQSYQMQLARKIILWIFPLFVLGFLLTMSEAYLKSVRVEEIPYRRTPQRMASVLGGKYKGKTGPSSGIHLISSLEHQRTFLHLFHVPCKKHPWNKNVLRHQLILPHSRYHLLLCRQGQVALCAGIYEIACQCCRQRFLQSERQLHQTVLHQVDSG